MIQRRVEKLEVPNEDGLGDGEGNSTVTICIECGRGNPDSNRFCSQCGAALETEKRSSGGTTPAKGAKPSAGKGTPGKSIRSDYPRIVAHVPNKKRKKVLKIHADFDPKYKSIKKTPKKSPTKRVARKRI